MLTGSSARKLKRSGVDLMAGRALVCSLHPYMAAELGKRFRLAEALEWGMLPLVVEAQEPKATRTLDFPLRSFAIYSCSSVRIAPLKKQTSMCLSGIASTSLYLVSMATGQKSMSAFATTSKIFSFISKTAISQPPQLEAQ